MFRPTKTKSQQTEQVGCSFPDRSSCLTLPLLLDRRHAIHKRSDEPCRHCLMLHHRQMATVSQEHRLRLGQEPRHSQLMRRRDNGVLGSDDVEHWPADLG